MATKTMEYKPGVNIDLSKGVNYVYSQDVLDRMHEMIMRDVMEKSSYKTSAIDKSMLKTNKDRQR